MTNRSKIDIEAVSVNSNLTTQSNIEIGDNDFQYCIQLFEYLDKWRRELITENKLDEFGTDVVLQLTKEK